MILKLFLQATLVFFLLNSDSYCQLTDCSITYLDSNHVGQVFNDVTLISYNSDILTFAKNFSIHKLNIKNLKSLEYSGNTNSAKGLLTGAAIGLALGITFAIMISDISFHGSSKNDLNPLKVIGGGLILGGIGALIGGSIQGTHRENVRVDFSKLSLKQARIRIQNILKFYGC
ncbi:MAG: hypothetical protein ABIY50_05140 [Ignavibacteria bacterium]